MKYINKAAMVAVAAACGILLSACATSPTPNVRTYYVDRHCNYFYVDSMGNRVIEGRYNSDDRLMGLPLHQDAMGRWYFEDAFGNRIYQSRYCR